MSREYKTAWILSKRVYQCRTRLPYPPMRWPHHPWQRRFLVGMYVCCDPARSERCSPSLFIPFLPYKRFCHVCVTFFASQDLGGYDR